MVSPFICPPQYLAGLEEVKRAVGIRHHYLDSWIYLYYENKKYDVKETIAKLNRRDIMEKTVFSTYAITPSLKKSMRSGIVQYVGRDYEGRPVLFFNTARDFPRAEERPERQSNMDMFLGWTVRCSAANPTSKVTWLINQKDSSMRKNTDLFFQKDMALRISKFFPGVVAKMYICNMSTALTFVMRPLLRQLPRVISDCIFMYSASDLESGKLLEIIPPDVLPIAMGGKNDCDNQENYNFFAESVEQYFEDCMNALSAGISIKEMEMMAEYGVDRHGCPITEKEGGGNESDQQEEEDGELGFASGSGADHHTSASFSPSSLPSMDLTRISCFPFASVDRMSESQKRKTDESLKALCYQAGEVRKSLSEVMPALRDGKVSSHDVEEILSSALSIEKAAKNLLLLCPPTSFKLNGFIFAWLLEPLNHFPPEPAPLESFSPPFACTSPDDFLLSLQSSSVEYLDDCYKRITEHAATEKLLHRLSNVWSSNLTYQEMLSLLMERCASAWKSIVPRLQQYIECKVVMAIAEFIRFHGLLVSGGLIDVSSTWFTALLSGLVQYREMRRRAFIFHIFPPPLFSESRSGSPSASPTVEDILQQQSLDVSFANAMHVVSLVERSLQNTLDQLVSPVTINVAARNVVDAYLEETSSKVAISYESQRTGLSCHDLVQRKRAEAYECLQTVRAPVEDFLFSLASITWIKENCDSSPPPPWQTVFQLLCRQESEMMKRKAVREHSRLITNGFAATAYNMQGSFSHSPYAASSSICTQEPPEGQAMALSLLYVSACARQCGNKVREGGHHMNDGCGSLSPPPVSHPHPTNCDGSIAPIFLHRVTLLQKTSSSLLDEVMSVSA